MKNVRRLLKIEQLHAQGILGQEIGVAILDTGIYKHNDFIKPFSRIVAFKDFVNSEIKPYDDNGHGTHVAGICASNGISSGGVYAGIAPKCHLVVAKVLDKYGIGSVDTLEKAMEWVLYNKKRYGLQIVNLSVGTYGTNKVDTKRLIKVVESAWDEGLVVLTAAGNKGPKPYSITAPGISRKIITVGTSEDCIYQTRGGKNYRNYSGRGPTREYIVKPEVVAPGCNITSCTNRNSLYVNKSGTSMSTPIVSGVVALVLATIEMESYLRINKEIKKAIFETSIDIGREKNRQGWGLINPLGLIEVFDRRITI